MTGVVPATETTETRVPRGGPGSRALAWAALLAVAAPLAGSAAGSPPAAEDGPGRGGASAGVVVAGTTSPAPMPLVSRGLPAFASSGPASAANDADYASQWSGTGSSWLAYDLAGAGALGMALVAWYSNDAYGYDHSRGALPEGVPGDYVIEVHSGSASARPPASGWATAVTVRGNRYANRQHAVDLRGRRWIRFRGISGAREGTGLVRLNLDVFDARGGFTDSWVFVGDSNTALYMTHAPKGARNFSERVQASRPRNFPAYLNCGVPGLHAIGGGLPVVRQVLADYPEARYVAITLGGNDANAGLPTTFAFHDAYRSMVDAVLAAGRIPVIPRTVIWHGRPEAYGAINAPSPHSLNNQLARLASEYEGRVKVGPDLWTPLEVLRRSTRGQPTDASGHPLVEEDLTHASDPWGVAFARDLWAEAMLQAVY
jgi:lysophospholipase L1-like esterase